MNIYHMLKLDEKKFIFNITSKFSGIKYYVIYLYLINFLILNCKYCFTLI